ncbi:MAG: 4-amino-4-deoxy-L-arabinose transferase-like glycosyltransferase [Crocinitomicaceae bacterium]|jgi:4-amino-4-deoxy-L-arabinose transferase-like glycosyltransferase
MNFQRVKSFLNENKYLLVFAGILVIYAFNLFIDVMDVDAAQYASISMEMSQNGSYLEVYHRGMDYLDKPPLSFWMSSASITMFGINNFAYKLPAFLLAILGIYSTYRFTCLFYSKKTGIFAALILASTQALFLMTNDVRTDTSLLAFVIFSVWQLMLFVQRNSWKNLILGFIGVGLAMLAKGPIGIVAIAAALGTHFILKREWRHIFKWQWLVGICIAALLLIPMTYGLYTQFDLHPEKIVYDLQGPSGVEFFYWTQSFGRITGDSAWQDDSGFFFFFHSILWDFQPWILYLILGLAATIGNFLRKTKSKSSEFITLGGFVVVFFALSLSHFKLPHYIFVTFPFAAIIAARFLVNITNKQKWLLYVQAFFNSLFWIIIALGTTLFFPIQNVFLPIVLVLLFCISWYAFLKQRILSNRIFLSAITTIIAFNLTLATHFYPELVGNYQAGGNAGRMVVEEGIPLEDFVYYKIHDHSLDFYRGGIVQGINLWDVEHQKPGVWIYTDSVGYDEIKGLNLPIELVAEFDDFPVTQLKIPFLFEATRASTLSKVYIVERR